MKNSKIPLLALCGLFCASLSLSAQDDPVILFVSDNLPALDAARSLVIQEHNIEPRIAWVKAGNNANDYVNIEARDIPDFDSKVEARLADFGLQPTDPADKGFTDVLTAAGYTVVRSQSTRSVDPIFGTVTETHEFQPTVPITSDPQRMKMSEEQLAKLRTYDMIIMSPNTRAARYSWAGGTTMELHAQWTSLTQPVLSMNAVLTTTNEFGSYGWGWTYGFTTAVVAGADYDRRDTDPRWVAFDYLPTVVNDDPMLAGLVPQNGKLDIYLPYETNRLLPTVVRKFSNNENYLWNENVKVILEYDFPTFFVNSVGEIDTRDPVLSTYQANVQFFNVGGVTPPERVLTPAGPRVYFAAGMGVGDQGSLGFYNLNENGTRLFLNIVEAYVGAGGGDTPPYACASTIFPEEQRIDPQFKLTHLGAIADTNFPNVYHAPSRQWFHVIACADAGDSVDAGYYFYMPATATFAWTRADLMGYAYVYGLGWRMFDY